MNLGKMVSIFCNNLDGIIVNIEKLTENNMENLYIDVKIKYLAKHLDETHDRIKYKIINFKRMELSVDAQTSYYDMGIIKKMQLSVIDAEIGFDHSLLINVWNRTISRGKLYIWADYQNDIKIYDQNNNEIEYSAFNNIVAR